MTANRIIIESNKLNNLSFVQNIIISQHSAMTGSGWPCLELHIQISSKLVPEGLLYVYVLHWVEYKTVFHQCANFSGHLYAQSNSYSQ